MKTICIVDDQLLVLDALKLILEEAGDILLIGAFLNAEEFLDKYESLQPDITIMDLDLPGISGIEAINIVKAHYPDSKFLVLSNYNDDEKLFEALKAGAAGYLLKRTSFEDIPSALESVHNGGAPMTPEIAKKVISYFQRHSQTGRGNFHQLTEKETIVLKLLSDGFLYKEIAEKLSVGIDAIKKHTQHIYQKLQVQTRSEAIKKYLTS